jgi:methyl-accepting chemotaxis protein
MLSIATRCAWSAASSPHPKAAMGARSRQGFAVVASEVKNLANQTGKATEDISAQIAGMQTATGEAVIAIKAITETIGRIHQIAATIAAAVEEQGAATQEIARSVQQAAGGAREVSDNVSASRTRSRRPAAWRAACWNRRPSCRSKPS